MADCIPYKSIPYYTKLILDYLDQKEELAPFYHRFPSLENLKAQAEEKQKSFPQKNRDVLVKALQEQYAKLSTSPETKENIERLRGADTFTVTTGHQLNLFTGPLYFFYKIISVVKLTEQLKEAYPAYNFVPVFWMAGEDHDFDEINSFNFKGRQFWWDSKQTGGVGNFLNQGLEPTYQAFSEALNSSDYAEELRRLFRTAYLDHETLSAATFYLGNTFFKDRGLVIIDSNHPSLKRLFAPYLKDELSCETAYRQVRPTADKLLEAGYHAQVNPREINLFYLKKNLRKRIVKEEDRFLIKDTTLVFSKEEMFEELQSHPERFSPNAIMRPLFQEVILPNLCYVGGSGELAYWLELKSYFEAVKVVFPSLLMRNSALLMTQKQKRKQQKLGLNTEDLFLSPDDLKTVQTKRISEIPIDFSPQKKQLEKQFIDLYRLAEKTDRSFIGAVAAEEQKQKKGLKHLEKRLLKAQKRRLKDELTRASAFQKTLFPGGNLQERKVNFSVFYEAYGPAFKEAVFEALNPLESVFNIIYLND